MKSETITVIAAKEQDLEAINRLIERAVQTWALPDRVKRLAMPTYFYTPADLQAMDLVGAYRHGQLVGAAAWEAGPDHGVVALHGVYVDPSHWRHGVGSTLLAHVERAARARGFTTLVVKAQAGASAFFLQRGYQEAAGGAGGGYSYLLSKAIGGDRAGLRGAE